jgi:hypothetical protein
MNLPAGRQGPRAEKVKSFFVPFVPLWVNIKTEIPRSTRSPQRKNKKTTSHNNNHTLIHTNNLLACHC